MMVVMSSQKKRVRINPVQIDRRIDELAEQIFDDYRDKDPLCVVVLRGAALFCADLVRKLNFRLRVDFIGVTSYGPDISSCGQLKMTKDLDLSVRDQHVVLIEDIVDSGLTVNYLLKHLKSRGPASIRVCSLLSKPSRREVNVRIDYLGFEIPDRFVVGYGLDWNQQYRNLPFITSIGDASDPLKGPEVSECHRPG